MCWVEGVVFVQKIFFKLNKIKESRFEQKEPEGYDECGF